MNDMASAENGAAQTILVVDDDELSLALLALQLNTAGYSVLSANSGEAAIRVAAAQSAATAPAIVLSDLQMPGLCGHALAQALRTLLPEAVLVAMSASEGDTTGYHAFTGKPLHVRDLQKALQGVSTAVETPGESSAEVPLLDERTYKKLSGMMSAEALAEVYEVCLRDVRQRAGQLLELADKDATEFRRIAHTMKGGASMVGATGIASIAAYLETGRYQDVDIPEAVNKLLYFCDQLERILMTKVNLC